MAVLEKVMQLRQQGKTEPEIINSLQQEGTSPQEINEALSQSQIKSEIATQNQPPQLPPEQKAPPPQPPQYTSEAPPQQSQMQPSMAQQPPMQEQPTQEPYPPQEQPPTEQAAPGQYTQEQYPAEANMGQYQEPAYEQPAEYGTDVETINEVADQIVDEKTSKMKKQITSLIKFKEDAQLEIERVSKQLAKIESTMNELQMAIIGKIGEYGKDIQNISREMSTTQESFSKVLNPLTDNIRELQKITGKTKTSKPKPKTSKKKSETFEDYLR
jgi:DNA-binding transcriptional MerR regulator